MNLIFLKQLLMKNYYYLAAALVLASCSSDEFIGDASSLQSENGMISFSQGVKKMTRATKTGADAATELGGQFTVMGTKGEYAGGKIAQTKVFDNYKVKYTAGSAYSTASNTANWEYVGVVPGQSIKYWDYSADHYDFIAASGATITPITPATATASIGGAYTFTGSAKIADMVTVEPADYNKTVTLTFKNSGSQVRLGFYETIPGYSVKNIKFYENLSDVAVTIESETPADGDDVTGYYTDATCETPATGTADGSTVYYKKVSHAATDAKLISSTDNIVSGGEYLVYFPVVNDPSNPENNKAKVIASTSGGGTVGHIQDLGAITYNSGLLGTTSSGASFTDYAGVSSNEGNASSLSIRIDYTLVSDDGSGEEILVSNARAVVPVQYAEWKTNYAYTYLFKLSANTNGTTGGINPGANPGDPVITPDPEGLYAITFDAVVESTIEGFQETVTTVATPSVTSYQEGVVVTAGSECVASKDIYVMIDGVSDMENAKVYELSAPATEAEVIDALNISPRTLGLTEVVSAIDASVTTIPTAGGDATVTAGKAGMIAAGTLTTGKSYAVVYETKVGTPTDKYVEYAVTLGDPVDGYYTTTDGVLFTACASTDVAVADVHYYKKATVSDGEYAVKVIKIQ